MKEIKIIRVNKLFGKYDNEIDLSSRGIIFIGENGVGKTTLMRILQCLMNFNLAELIKYDFESIDVEVSAKNGRILEDTIKYSDLLPTNEEIKKYIKEQSYYKYDLYGEWDAYKDCVPNEVKIESFGDDSTEMTDEEKIDVWDDNLMDIEFEEGNFNTATNYVLDNLIKNNEFKNIIRKIIKKEEINDFYYDNYISKFEHDGENYNVNTDGYIYGYTEWSYSSLKYSMNKIVSSIRELLENNYFSNDRNTLINKKNTFRIIKNINDNIDKPVDILDMTKVYEFSNEIITSSLISNKLLDWVSNAPSSYDIYKAVNRLKSDVYRNVLEELKNKDFDNLEFASKDISELSNNNKIEINNIINFYFYEDKDDYDFIAEINKKELEYSINYNDAEFFINTEQSSEEDKTKLKDKFIKYIRPITFKNSPFDKDWDEFTNMQKKMFCDFCTKEWHLFEENINPKIKVLQELLDKYMMNKDVEVTPMGLIVKSKDDNRNIPLNSLSSGEKKLLVIFMHCLFNEDVPIIIDEPEISLSIIWQENLLPDLLEKTSIKQVIVATHSSAVISDSSLDKYIIPLPNSVVDQGGNVNE